MKNNIPSGARNSIPWPLFVCDFGLASFLVFYLQLIQAVCRKNQSPCNTFRKIRCFINMMVFVEPWSPPSSYFHMGRTAFTMFTAELSRDLSFSWVWGALHFHVGEPTSLLHLGGTQPLGEPLLPEGGVFRSHISETVLIHIRPRVWIDTEF